MTPAAVPVKSTSKLLQDFVGSNFYIEASDEEMDDCSIPIVVIYNCLDNFVGTTVLSDEEQEMFYAKLCLEHLGEAQQMFFKINFQVLKKPALQNSMADLMHNVAAVKSMITSSKEVEITISRGSRREDDAPGDAANAPGATQSQDSGDDVQLDMGAVTQVLSQGSQEARIQHYEKKKRKAVKQKQKKAASTAKETHKCPKCDKEWPRKADMEEHLKAQHGHRFRCSLCTEKFMHKRSMLRHQREKHPEPDEDKEFHCGQDSCYLGEDNSHQVKRHMIKRHGTGFSQKCKHCGKKVSLLGTRKHDSVCTKRVDIKSRIIRCPSMLSDGTQCRKKFITAGGFESHDARIHKGTGGMACDVCGKLLASKSTLNRHQAVHRNDDKLAEKDQANYTLIEEEQDNEDIPSEEDEGSTDGEASEGDEGSTE